MRLVVFPIFLWLCCWSWRGEIICVRWEWTTYVRICFYCYLKKTRYERHTRSYVFILQLNKTGIELHTYVHVFLVLDTAPLLVMWRLVGVTYDDVTWGGSDVRCPSGSDVRFLVDTIHRLPKLSLPSSSHCHKVAILVVLSVIAHETWDTSGFAWYGTREYKLKEGKNRN